MLNRFRRRLQMIRYYSAAPQRTAWTRAMDVALAATLVLAWPAAWVADLVVRAQRTPTIISLEVRRDAVSGFRARLIRPDEPMAITSNSLSEVVFVILNRVDRGFPMRTTIHDRPAEFEFEKGSAIQIEVKDESKLAEMRRAIGEAAAPDFIIDDADRTRRRWPAWFVNGLLWWVLLWFVFSLSIRLAEYFWVIAFSMRYARRVARRAQNLCANCGYDLRGLDFNARCPECGELV